MVRRFGDRLLECPAPVRESLKALLYRRRLGAGLSSPRIVGLRETSPLGWYDAGPLVLQKRQTFYRPDYTNSMLCGTRIRMSDLCVLCVLLRLK